MSIKKNFAYSSILTTSSYIFPLLTFPYVNRVLGVNNIGICSFVEGVVGYFMLFSAMGIGTLAIREVAKYKSDKLSLSKAFSSLLSLNMLTTFIAMVILFVSILIIPEFERHEGMFYIAIGQILFKTLLIAFNSSSIIFKFLFCCGQRCAGKSLNFRTCQHIIYFIQLLLASYFVKFRNFLCFCRSS